MYNGNGAVYIAGLIFGLLSLIHLARIFCPFEVIVGGVDLPSELSYIGFVIFGLLSIALFRARSVHLQHNLKEYDTKTK